MNQTIEQAHECDGDGNPAGGLTKGQGITIMWQDGPLGRGEDRQEPNGAFVEGVISAAMGRLEFYQDSKFNCGENGVALMHLGQALDALNKRTRIRESRAVEGTHQV